MNCKKEKNKFEIAVQVLGIAGIIICAVLCLLKILSFIMLLIIDLYEGFSGSSSTIISNITGLITAIAAVFAIFAFISFSTGQFKRAKIFYPILNIIFLLRNFFIFIYSCYENNMSFMAYFPVNFGNLIFQIAAPILVITCLFKKINVLAICSIAIQLVNLVQRIQNIESTLSRLSFMIFTIVVLLSNINSNQKLKINN